MLKELKKYIYDNLLFICTYLIPVFVLLYIYIPNIRDKIFIHGIVIFFIGITDIYYQTNKLWEKTLSTLFHILLIIPLLYYPVRFISKQSIFLLFIALFVIYILPLWAYKITKKEMILLYIILYSIIYFIYNNFIGYYIGLS